MINTLMRDSLNLQDISTTPFDTIPFTKLKDEHFPEQLDLALTKAKGILAEVDDSSSSYEETVGKLDLAVDALNRVVVPLLRFRSLRSSEKIFSVIESRLPDVDQFLNSVMTDEAIFQRVHALLESAELSGEQRESVTLVLKEFKKNGLHLSKEERGQLAQLSEEIKSLENKFIQNLLSSEEATFVTISDKTELLGIPDSILAEAAKRAKQKGESGWDFKLTGSDYATIVTYAEAAELRKKMYFARASIGHSEEYSNTKICKQILDLRQKRAQVLGFESHAEFKAQSQESTSAASILELLISFKEELEPLTEKQLIELSDKTSNKINPWDFHYFKNLRNSEMTNKDEVTFEFSNLLEGVFTNFQRIFGLHFYEDSDISVYSDEHVAAYRVEDADGNVQGIVYLDLYSREGKRSGNMMATLREKGVFQGYENKSQLIVSTNISYVKRNQVTLQELGRILHEFGHAIHALIPKHSLPRLNSIFHASMGVIELPSTLLEYLPTIPECLSLFLGRPATSEEIAAATKSTEDPYSELFSVSNAIYDLKLHSLNDLSPLENWEQFERDNLQTSLQKNSLPEDFYTSANSFRHIMAGGYDASYYSYVMSRKLAKQIFEEWSKRGIFDQDFCEQLKECVYTRGALLDLEGVESLIVQTKLDAS